jgi:integrase
MATTWRRCKCKDEDGREIGTKCPELRRPDGSYANHGTWYARVELPPQPIYENGKPVLSEDGTPATKRKVVKRGGFAKKADAEQWAEEAKSLTRTGVDVTRKITVAAYLNEWIDSRSDLKPATRVSYAQHIRQVWTPTIGHYQLRDLRRAHVQAALDALTCSPASKQRYRATLRAALNDAKREGLVTVNVAELVKLPSGKRPKAQVWTDPLVVEFELELETRFAAALKRAGNAERFNQWYPVKYRPGPVMVWTASQVRRFLDQAHDDRLYAFFHLIAWRGLRRGEACGLRRQDIDLDRGVLRISRSLTKAGGQITEGPAKTDSSERTVTLDGTTVRVLRDHLARQAAQRAHVGSGWTETPYLFTNPDGTPLDPEEVTHRFARLAFEAVLPPIRLHDLRHSAASIMYEAGVDPKVISSTLGHSTLAMTMDTYTSVFENVDKAAAEAVAALMGARPADGPPMGSRSSSEAVPTDLS